MGKRASPLSDNAARHLGKRAGIFPNEHSVPPTEMKNV